MEPLLKITNIPITFELKINKAHLEYQNGTADLEITRNDGKMSIRSSPIRLQLDTFEARDSISPASVTSNIQRFAQSGKNMAYQVTASNAQDGHMLLKAKIGEDAIGNIIRNKTDKYFGEKQFNIGFIPDTQAEMTWVEPNITIDYQMDKLNFDWHIMKGDFEFIPGNIEMEIMQYPDVVIEYIGSPLYVPPSADPNYKPIDTKA